MADSRKAGKMRVLKRDTRTGGLHSHPVQPAPSSGSASPLLDLPDEILVSILRQLFVPERLPVLQSKRRPPMYRRHLPTEIFRVNRYLNAQARKAMHQECLFSVVLTNIPQQPFLRMLGPLGSSLLAIDECPVARFLDLRVTSDKYGLLKNKIKGRPYIWHHIWLLSIHNLQAFCHAIRYGTLDLLPHSMRMVLHFRRQSWTNPSTAYRQTQGFKEIAGPLSHQTDMALPSQRALLTPICNEVWDDSPSVDFSGHFDKGLERKALHKMRKPRWDTVIELNRFMEDALLEAEELYAGKDLFRAADTCYTAWLECRLAKDGLTAMRSALQRFDVADDWLSKDLRETWFRICCCMSQWNAEAAFQSQRNGYGGLRVRDADDTHFSLVCIEATREALRPGYSRTGIETNDLSFNKALACYIRLIDDEAPLEEGRQALLICVQLALLAPEQVVLFEAMKVRFDLRRLPPTSLLTRPEPSSEQYGWPSLVGDSRDLKHFLEWRDMLISRRRKGYGALPYLSGRGRGYDGDI